MEQKGTGSAVRVGMTWGGIGGVVGFLVSLLGSLAGIIAAGFIGVSCGRRASAAERGQRSGALSGLIAGAVAAPVVVIGSAAGAVVSARRLGAEQISAAISDMLGTSISPDEAWQLFLLSLIFAAFLQVGILILSSTAAGAWAGRK